MTETLAARRATFLGSSLAALESAAGTTAPPKPNKDSTTAQNAEYAKRLAALTAKAKAMTAPIVVAPEPSPAPVPKADPVVVVPPIPVPIPTPTTALHPDEVQAIKLGRGANYDLIRTAGFKNDRKLLIPSPTQLPYNTELVDMGYGWGKTTLVAHPGADLSGFDVRGFTVYWNSPFAVKMENGQIGSDGFNMIPPIYYEGPVSNSAQLLLNNVTIDQKNMNWGPNRGSCMHRLPTVLEATSLRMTRIASAWANHGPGNTVRINGFYSEGPGQYAYYPLTDPVTGATIPDTGQKDHPEIIHNHGADMEIINFMYDSRYPSHPIPPVPQWIVDKMTPGHPTYTPGFKDPPERRLRHALGTGWGLFQPRTDPSLDPNSGAKMATSFPPGRMVHKDGLLLNHPDSFFYYNWQISTSGFPFSCRFEDTAQQTPYFADGSGQHVIDGSGIAASDTPLMSGVRNVVFETSAPMPGRINVA